LFFKPHVHTLHDVQLYAPSGLIIKGKENNLTQKIVNALGYPALMKKLFGSPALVVSPTKFLAKFYQDKGFFHQSKVLILPNPADRPETALGVNNDGSLRLLYLGQLHSGKGVLQLIEVIKDSALKNVRLRVVGLGPDLRKALDLAHGDERITFYGWRNRSDILDILSQTDVVVLPSICYENSPTVILEALSYGLPVITADIGGAGELIRDGHNGWKFEPGNWKQLGSIISTLAENPSSLHTMADACRATVAHHTVRHYIDNLITALETSKVVDN
jgi:glycosyltransferase involved in cell wall biosynthesis